MHVGMSLLTLFPGRVGGVETNVRGLLRTFGSGKTRHRVTALANRYVVKAYLGFERGPVSLHHVRSYRPGNRRATRLLAMGTARALPRMVAADVPDDVDLLHHVVTVPIPKLPIPTIVTVYDVQHLEFPEFFSPFERRYRCWAYDEAARSADLVITTSEYSRQRLIHLAGVPAERVQSVHIGIDTEHFTPSHEHTDGTISTRLALPERFVLYPANLWPHKNHRRLLQALGEVDPKLSLVLTGDPSGLDALRRDVSALGLQSRVRHVGYVAESDLPSLYRAAEALVFPSLYEGFGLPPLEAMACGCPVAASPRGSLAEVIGGAAVIFDPESVDEMASAIERVANDLDVRRTLVEAGLARAVRFSWAAAAEAHSTIYDSMAP